MFVNGKIIPVACVTSVSAHVRRESWNEGAKKRGEKFSRNNSIRKACYTQAIILA